MVIKIEVVHPRFKAASAKAQETWIKRIAAGVIDGVILVGLLVSLGLVAHEVDMGSSMSSASVTAAVILGFMVL